MTLVSGGSLARQRKFDCPIAAWLRGVCVCCFFLVSLCFSETAKNHIEIVDQWYVVYIHIYICRERELRIYSCIMSQKFQNTSNHTYSNAISGVRNHFEKTTWKHQTGQNLEVNGCSAFLSHILSVQKHLRTVDERKLVDLLQSMAAKVIAATVF